MWNVIEGDSANCVWAKALTSLSSPELPWSLGRGGSIKEILHVAITIRDPRRRWTTARSPALNPAFALAEVIWIMAGRRDAAFLKYFNRSLQRFAGSATDFHGAYGHRLRSQFGIDQLERAYNALNANPSSRQVVLQMWDPRVDMPDESGVPRDPDIPCNTQSILKVRDGCLEWVQIMRSNDIFLGLPHNLVQFTFMQEIFAGWLGLKLGHYHHLSDSLHIYERDSGVVSEGPPVFRDHGLSFALPKNIFEDSIAELNTLANRIIEDRNAPSKIIDALGATTLPEPYLNVLRVLTTEGLRRRRRLDLAETAMVECTDLAFQHLWREWRTRVAENF